MKDFPSLQEFLKNGSFKNEQQKSNLKKEYRKLYLKEYRRRNSCYKRFTIRVTKEEFRRIDSYRNKVEFPSTSKFIIDSCIAYLDKEYLVPNFKQIEAINRVLNMMANDISLVINKMNSHIKVKNIRGEIEVNKKSIVNLIKEFIELRKIVLNQKEEFKVFISTPPIEIIGFKWDEIKGDKSKIEKLILHLRKYRERLA